ncbi:hypothetical protein [Actinomadura macrotermitis]|uniref:hypothetical protein n=1 Tax=Actinomadura macrotermitis TaxID=2585200 RepID=UPI00129812D7|nr:hypothetical protein [Actinomadura macrotermitis]
MHEIPNRPAATRRPSPVRRFLEWLTPDGRHDDWLEPDRHDPPEPPACPCGGLGDFLVLPT